MIKQKVFLVMSVILIFTSINFVMAQDKVNLSNVNTIQSQQAKTKLAREKLFTKRNSKSFKEGYNKLFSNANESVLIVIKNGKATKVVTTNSKGEIKDQQTIDLIGGGVQEYHCFSDGCICFGDVDCNNMFTNGECGDRAGCSDGVCWCYFKAY
ncbi:MAG: hypothetical protein HOP11_10045 [Saprospiraceae bacterium]|nr:hypothetical protein [Saprospiraceae bacterium]